MTTYCNTPLGPVAQPLDFTGDSNLSVYTRDTIKRYRFGTRSITWDGRVRKYAKAGGTLNTDLLAQTIVGQHVGQRNVAATTVVGATKVSLTITSADGAVPDGLIAKDELESGYLILFPGTRNSMNRLILGNSAVAAGGGTLELDLDEPLNVIAVRNVTKGECMASPYSSIMASTSGDAHRSAIGLPLVPAVSGEYCWIQTWGPCWVAPHAGVGAAAHVHQCVARHDGSLDYHQNASAEGGTGYVYHQQHVGFTLSRAPDNSQGAPFIMLQISI